VTKPLVLNQLELPSSEKQIPQVVENLESGGEPKEVLEPVELLRRQVLYPPELRAHGILLHSKALPRNWKLPLASTVSNRDKIPIRGETVTKIMPCIMNNLRSPVFRCG
jgi:hypothetical protein